MRVRIDMQFIGMTMKVVMEKIGFVECTVRFGRRVAVWQWLTTNRNVRNCSRSPIEI